MVLHQWLDEKEGGEGSGEVAMTDKWKKKKSFNSSSNKEFEHISMVTESAA